MYALTAFAFLIPTTVAQEKGPEEIRVTYKLIGLFSPDREKDLRASFEDIESVTLVGLNFDDGEITIEFLPAKAFPGAKQEQYLERFDQQLRHATSYTFSAKPRRTIARDKLQSIVIPASGLDCKACCLAAYESIANLDGVEQATASFKDGKITALIDPTKTDRSKLEEALRKKGVTLGK